MEVAYIPSPLGITEIKGDEQGICSISILHKVDQTTAIIPEVLEDAVYQLNEYFEGKRQVFNLDLNPAGSDFQQEVWTALQKIPFGRTWSYMDLAKHLGNTGAIRAVAAANGKNPIWIVIPCHRVIGSDGSLTGYAGGLHRKSWLLEHESPVKQTRLF